MFTCTVCGKTVCIQCYLKDERLCINCNKKLRPQAPPGHEDGPPVTYGDADADIIEEYDDY